jgi:dolichol kinase
MADEVTRRVVHAAGMVFPAIGIVDPSLWWVVRLCFFAGAVLALVLEGLRLFVGLDWAIYDKLTREYEQDNVAGYALYVFSSAGVIWVFEPTIAIPAVLMLMIGDPVSGLLGSGELRDVKEGWVMLAMFAVCALLAVPFVGVVAGTLGALGATLADGFKPVVRGSVIDDNLTIPPVAALSIVVGLDLAARLAGAPSPFA